MMADSADTNNLEQKVICIKLPRVKQFSSLFLFMLSLFCLVLFCFVFFIESLSTPFYLSISRNKRPHFGELHFQEFAFKLKLKLMAEEGETNEYEKTKKTIDLKGN